MSVLTRPQMIVRLDHLIQNYETLKKMAPASVAAAVVKNDAYGLGAALVVRALYKNGCRHFFVAQGAREKLCGPRRRCRYFRVARHGGGQCG